MSEVIARRSVWGKQLSKSLTLKPPSTWLPILSTSPESIHTATLWIGVNERAFTVIPSVRDERENRLRPPNRSPGA